MKQFSLFFLMLLMSLLLTSGSLARDIEQAFSPSSGATELVLETIHRAQKSIRVAAYSFTSEPIARALIEAKERGVNVKVVLDKSQRKARKGKIKVLKEAGIPVRINSKYAIMHNKFMVIDKEILQLGSYNYTKAAGEKNAENVMVIENESEVINSYNKQWNKLWREAKEE